MKQVSRLRLKLTAHGFSTLLIVSALCTGVASAQDAIRIGMLLPMSGGPFIPVGADVSDGFELAIQESGGPIFW